MNSRWSKDIVNSQFLFRLVLLPALHLRLLPAQVPQKAEAERDMSQLREPQIKQETKSSLETRLGQSDGLIHVVELVKKDAKTDRSSEMWVS